MGIAVRVGIAKVIDRVVRDVGSRREDSSRGCGSPEALLKHSKQMEDST